MLIVIPAKAGIQGPGGNRGPVFEIVPSLSRDDAWTPVFTGETTFYDFIIFELLKRAFAPSTPR
jgi:hypothetical protein